MNVNLLDLFLLTLMIIHLAESYWYLQRMKASLNWLGDPTSSVWQNEPPNILHLLIPVYQEAHVIKSSVEYFEKFVADYAHVKVHYITTEKEGSDGPTIAALRELARYYSFTQIHYPQEDGKKADQLNWAIRRIIENISEGSAGDRQIYFGIYDVDSRPEPEAIKAMLYVANHGEEQENSREGLIYQQPSIYLENYKRIGSFQKVGALLQTKWELCRNVAVLRANYKRHQTKRPLLSLPACTGHGLFMRSDALRSEALLQPDRSREDISSVPGPFDTETLAEDLHLGYKLAFHGLPITVLKAVDFTQYPPAPLATIRQTSRWFSGEANLYRYYTKDKQAPKNWYLFLLILKRYFLTFQWAFGAPLIFFAFIVLTVRHPFSIILICLSIYLYIYIPFKMLYSFPRWKDYLGNTPNFFILVLLGTLRPLFNALGPFHYLLTGLLNSLLGKSPMFVRTPKN